MTINVSPPADCSGFGPQCSRRGPSQRAVGQMASHQLGPTRLKSDTAPVGRSAVMSCRLRLQSASVLSRHCLEAECEVVTISRATHPALLRCAVDMFTKYVCLCYKYYVICIMMTRYFKGQCLSLRFSCTFCSASRQTHLASQERYCPAPAAPSPAHRWHYTPPRC